MRNILDILPHLQNKYSFKCLYKYATFFHEIYVDLNKKSMVQLCFLLQSVVIVCWVQLGFDWWSSTISLSLPPQVVLFLFPSSSIMTFATLTTIKSPKPQIVHHPLLAYLWQNNSNLSKLPPNDVLFQYFFINNMHVRTIGSKPTSKFVKVDHCVQINCINLICLQIFITMSIQLGIKQNYHQKKWNFKSNMINIEFKMLKNILCTLV